MLLCEIQNSATGVLDPKTRALIMCELCTLQVHAVCTLTETYMMHGNSCCQTNIHHSTLSGRLGNRKILCDGCLASVVGACTRTRPVHTSVAPMVGRF